MLPPKHSTTWFQDTFQSILFELSPTVRSLKKKNLCTSSFQYHEVIILEICSFEKYFGSQLLDKDSIRCIIISRWSVIIVNSKSPIGVFDSGLGGLSVLKTLRNLFPEEDFIFLGDSLYNPYGIKTKEQIVERCIAICDLLVEKDVKAIVIACNTATSASVPLLRKRYDIDIIGMEPALKVACELGENQRIAVWATDYTLKEKKFSNLLNRFKDAHTIYKVPCPKLVRIVEEDRLEDKEYVQSVLEDYISQAGEVDSIVLGCTHFVFFKDYLQEMLPHVHVVDGNVGTANRVKDVLAKKGLLNSNQVGTVTLLNTLEDRLSLERKLLGE